MPPSDKNPHYPWQRYWVPHGESPQMDDGYFAEPFVSVGGFGYQRPTNGVSLLSLASVPCLILLGDVGMGKSTTASDEVAILKQFLREKNHAVELLNLRRVHYSLIGRKLFGNEAVAGWAQGCHPLTLFLDSLDECWRRIDELESILIEVLTPYFKTGSPPLFLRLLCRSAEWRSEMTTSLDRLFSKVCAPDCADSPVQTFTLAPLAKSNVHEAAIVRALDGENLLTRIADKGAQSLASHPITLAMLLETFENRGDFSGTRAQLYEEGCLQLCKDLQEDSGSIGQRSTSPAQRLAIAGRIAALSVLSNRYLIKGNLEIPASREDALDAADALGHFDETSNGEPVTVDKNSVRETLQTALFGESADGLQTWRHQSYAEYLAAQYLTNRRFSFTQLASLLSDDSVQPRIVPQLEETACWLIEMVPELFPVLAPTNADIFIRCIPAGLENRNRNLLAAAYLDLVRSNDAAALDWGVKPQLARLANPQLASVLNQFITASSETNLVRLAAIEIAAYSRCHDLENEIIAIFGDPKSPFLVRERAGFALEKLASDQLRTELKSRLSTAVLDDSHDDLRGYFLKVLWPSHLSVAEALKLMTPPKDWTYFGSYRSFLDERFLEHLSSDDIPLVLDWMDANDVDCDITEAYGYLGKRIMGRALREINRPVRDAILRVMLNDRIDVSHAFSAQDVSRENKLSLWRGVAESTVDVRIFLSAIRSYDSGLLKSEQVEDLVKEYRTSTSAVSKERWRTLIFAAFSPDDESALNAVSALAGEDLEVFNELETRTSCKVLPDEKNWMKREFLRDKENARLRRSFTQDLNRAIAADLDGFSAGEVWRFWRVMELLRRDPDPEHPTLFSGMLLTQAKAWGTASAEIQRQIVKNGLDYLQLQQVSEDKVWDTTKSYRPYDVVLPLLLIIYQIDRSALDSIPPPIWSKWAPVLFAYHSGHSEAAEPGTRHILKLLFQNASEAAHKSLSSFLCSYCNDDHRRALIWRLDCCWDSKIEEELISFSQDSGLKLAARADLYDLLFDYAPGKVLLQLETAFNERETCNVFAPNAAALLIRINPQLWAGRIITTCAHEPHFMRAVLSRLLRHGGKNREWLPAVSEIILAEWWYWLDTDFPDDPYEKQNGAGEVTIVHDIFHLKQAVLDTLVKRGNRDACNAIETLIRKLPHHSWLGKVLAGVRKASRRSNWCAPSASKLMESFNFPDRLLVRSARDLNDLILESLQEYQSLLRSAEPTMELWNEDGTRDPIRFPKDEANLSNCLKRHIERDLNRLGIVAEREVQIRRRFGEDDAQVVDISVAAIPFDSDGHPTNPVKVVIEVKCAWNDGVFDDMQKQLFHRYMANSDFFCGLYVVGYFSCPTWNKQDDHRKTRGANRLDMTELVQRLNVQASNLSGTDKMVSAVVLDARIGLETN